LKKFTFRFEAVERQRTIVLDGRVAELAEAQRKRQLADQLLAQRRESLADAGRPAGATFDARHELVRQRYLHALRAEIARREQQLAHIDREVEEARGRVAEAHRALRAIELLRERDLEEWKAEVRRAEGREIDEHNATRRPREGT
jgi:flagellar export protein FliJ